MKIFYITALSCFSCLPGFSQMVWGLVNSMSFKQPPDFPVAFNEDHLGLRTTETESSTWRTASRHSIAIIRFNNKMEVVQKSTITNGDLNFGYNSPKLLVVNKRIWLIAFDPGKGFQIGTITATEIDTKTLKKTGSHLIVSENEIDEGFNSDIFNLKIKSSADNNFHCIYVDNRSGKFFLSALNNEMKPIWKSKQNIPGYDSDAFNGIAVGNDGTVFMTTSKNNTQSSVTKFSLSGVPSTNTLDFGESKPCFVDILAAKNGDIMIGGILTRGSKFANEVFLAKVGNASAMEDLNRMEISKDILERLADDHLGKSASKNNPGLYQAYVMPKLIEQGDGRIKLITEARIGWGKDARQKMAYGGLLISDFKSKDNPFLLIPRFVIGAFQIYRDQFIARSANNKIVLMYTDHQDNLSRPLSEKQEHVTDADSGILVAATIDNNGVINRKKLNLKPSESLSESIVAFMLKEGFQK